MVWKITWEIWKIFTRAAESLKIGTLMEFFCPKLKIYELKISRVAICYDSEKRCKIERRIDFDEFWPDNSRISNIYTLIGCLWPKHIMLQLKKYKGVMFLFDGIEYWRKILKKTDFCFQKWLKEFGKFSPERRKVPKLGLWWDFFI